MQKLPFEFYMQDTKTVARELLGKVLVRNINGKKISGIIVETEAYLGIDDPSCHSRDGLKSKRNASMYLSGGYAYVYFIYGMYFCFNIVTKSPQEPEAVLIRAIEPKTGINFMKQQREKSKALAVNKLCNGPGKLAQSLAIDKSIDGKSLRGKEIYIQDSNIKLYKKDILTSQRIGIAKSNPAANWKLRFYLKNSDFVS